MRSEAEHEGVNRLLAIASLFLYSAAAQTVPADIVNARSVTVMSESYMRAGRETPQDAGARQNVENALRRWGRIRVETFESNADFVLVVSRSVAGLAMPQPRGPSGPGGMPLPVPQSPGMGGRFEDKLMLFRGWGSITGGDPMPVWEDRMVGGLSGDDPPLVRRLREQYEEQEKRTRGARDKKEAQKSAEERVRELARKAGLSEKEGGKLARQIGKKVEKDPGAIRRILEGDYAQVERWFEEMRPNKSKS